MIDSQAEQRKRLRCHLLARRNAMDPMERNTSSERIIAALTALPFFRDTTVFFIYCSYLSEVETGFLIRSCLAAGKSVAVPRALPAQSRMEAVLITDPAAELAPGYRGIPEPCSSLDQSHVLPPQQIQAAIVPGAVFDLTGHRLGYGGGYYDRFLGCDAPRALRIGLAFSAQVVERIPALGHDMPMDMLITETKVLTWTRSADENDCRL